MQSTAGRIPFVIVGGVLFPDQVIRAEALARTMVNVVVQKTAERENWFFENRDFRAMVDSPHLLGVIKARRQL